MFICLFFALGNLKCTAGVSDLILSFQCICSCGGYTSLMTDTKSLCEKKGEVGVNSSCFFF